MTRFRGVDNFASGTTAERPTLAVGQAGFLFYDTDLGAHVTWDGAAWAVSGGLSGTAETYTVNNAPAADRVLEAGGGATLADTNAVVASLIADLQARGVIA